MKWYEIYYKVSPKAEEVSYAIAENSTLALQRLTEASDKARHAWLVEVTGRRIKQIFTVKKDEDS